LTGHFDDAVQVARSANMFGGDARIFADQYCEEGERLRVYSTLVLKYFGMPNRKVEFEL